MIKLSPQREVFAQALAKHGRQTDAYREAYPNSKGKAKTQNEAASRLANDGKVLARLEELRKKIEDESIADAKERRRFWTEVMRSMDADMKDRLRASELSGKADGDFVERKIIQNPDGTGINQQQEIDLSKLSDSALEELRKIADDADDE